jgi:Flp pilus assembly protein TadD
VSVINKMLRDLDQRGAGPVKADASGAGSLQNTVSVSAAIKPVARSTWRLWLAAFLLLAGLAGAAWFGLEHQAGVVVSTSSAVALTATLSSSSPAPTATLAAVVASEPVPELPSLLVAQKPGSVTAKASVASQVATTKLLPAPTQVQVLTPAENAVQAAPLVTKGAAGLPERPADLLRMDMTLKEPPAAASKPVSETAELVAVSSAAAQALAQAQNLWRSGSHAAAMDLLERALTLIEGSESVSPPLVEKAALASLARELARMQLADGQVAQALALLQRLEPQLAQFADLWAMRGNAAQRLGQHAQAVHSYQQALLIKSDEPRWMLGQAVSLAALGQTAPAAGLAEKVRQQGALPADLAQYLRQLGVVIRVD